MMASSRFGELWCIWRDNRLYNEAKFRLFEAAVVSVLVYGCEEWDLTDRNLATLKVWCSRCLVN